MYLQEKVKCQVCLNKFDKSKNWYYNVCSNCPEELMEIEGRFKCHKCLRYIPYPDKRLKHKFFVILNLNYISFLPSQNVKLFCSRFRICAICSDSTGVIAIVLEDAEVRRLTGTNFFALQIMDSEVLLNDFYLL